jgi:DNA-binding response OmpR family regulator
MLILVAEDDPNLRRGLAELLQLEGFRTITAECGLSAIEAFDKTPPDFCLLDVSMPGIDGFEACRHIRGKDPHVPILFLTARNEEIDRIRGLGFGADDYMGKPFSTQELLARIRAISRRTAAASTAGRSPSDFIMCDLKIDPRALRAYRNSTAIGLSPREAAVLKYFHTRAGFVVSRNELYDHCWGQEHFPNSRALDQFISALRRKIENYPAEPRIIVTVHGAGYRFDP